MSANGNSKVNEELIGRAYRDAMTAIFKTFIEQYLGGAAAEYARTQCKKELVQLEWAKTELVKIVREG